MENYQIEYTDLFGQKYLSPCKYTREFARQIVRATRVGEHGFKRMFYQGLRMVLSDIRVVEAK